MMRSEIGMKSEHEHMQFTLSVVRHIIIFTSTPYRAPYNPAALAPEMSQLASLKAVSRVLTKNHLGSNSFID